jgi:hypothetical protein
LFVIQGEIALVADVCRQATVVNCGGRTILLELKRDDFVTLFAQEPFALAEIAIKLLQVYFKFLLHHFGTMCRCSY